MRTNVYSVLVSFSFLFLAIGGFGAERNSPVNGEIVDRLLGNWEGEMIFSPATRFSVIWRFEKNAAGSLVGFMDPYSREVASSPMKNLIVTATRISFDVRGGSFSGEILDNLVSGTWDEGKLIPMTMEKKKDIKLNREAMERLTGVWTGKANKLDLEFQFSVVDSNLKGTLDARRFLGFGEKGMLVTDVVLEGDKLSLRVPRVGGEFSATLSGSEARGIFTYDGDEHNLIITRE